MHKSQPIHSIGTSVRHTKQMASLACKSIKPSSNTSEETIFAALGSSDDVDGVGSIDLPLLLEALLDLELEPLGVTEVCGSEVCGSVIKRAPLIFCLPLDVFSGGGIRISARLAGIIPISTKQLSGVDLSFDGSDVEAFFSLFMFA